MNFIYFLDLYVSPIEYVFPILILLPILLIPTAGAIVGIVAIRRARIRRQEYIQSKTKDQTDTNTDENDTNTDENEAVE